MKAKSPKLTKAVISVLRISSQVKPRKTGLYRVIKKLLDIREDYRNNDLKLTWAVWYEAGLINVEHRRNEQRVLEKYEYITYENFKKALAPTKITKMKEIVQLLNPQLKQKD